MMFISAGIRFEANVEALNSVETTGNYSKHRRVPYLVKEDEFKIIYIPALSGESLAHAYQEILVKEADIVYGGNGTAPICQDCRRGEFFKSMNKAHLKGKVDVEKETKAETIEKGIVENCLVEDIGGFLYAEKPPVKRTSAFQFSYAVPVKRFSLLSVTEPQLHARHAQMREMKKRSDREGAAEQMLYYVEVGTALYAFTFNLDLDSIGISAFTGENLLHAEEKRQREQAALRAFARLISSKQFGAKLSRFFPVGDIVGVYLSITEGPFSVTSPIYDFAALTTAKRLKVIKEHFKEQIKLYIYDAIEDLSKLEEFDFVTICETPEEAVAKLL